MRQRELLSHQVRGFFQYAIPEIMSLYPDAA
jgi:hypothetical protein